MTDSFSLISLIWGAASRAMVPPHANGALAPFTIVRRRDTTRSSTCFEDVSSLGIVEVDEGGADVSVGAVGAAAEDGFVVGIVAVLIICRLPEELV